MSYFVIKAVSVRNGRETFCRTGRIFSVHGTLVDREDISDEDWARLEAEPMLHIREARDDEIDAAAARFEPVAGDALETLQLRVDEAIRSFGSEGFGQDGAPKIPALRKALPGDRDQIDARLRDAVWERMTAEGFAAPAAS